MISDPYILRAIANFAHPLDVDSMRLTCRDWAQSIPPAPAPMFMRFNNACFRAKISLDYDHILQWISDESRAQSRESLRVLQVDMHNVIIHQWRTMDFALFARLVPLAYQYMVTFHNVTPKSTGKQCHIAIIARCICEHISDESLALIYSTTIRLALQQVREEMQKDEMRDHCDFCGMIYDLKRIATNHENRALVKWFAKHFTALIAREYDVVWNDIPNLRRLINFDLLPIWQQTCEKSTVSNALSKYITYRLTVKYAFATIRDNPDELSPYVWPKIYRDISWRTLVTFIQDEDLFAKVMRKILDHTNILLDYRGEYIVLACLIIDKFTQCHMIQTLHDLAREQPTTAWTHLIDRYCRLSCATSNCDENQKKNIYRAILHYRRHDFAAIDSTIITKYDAEMFAQILSDVTFEYMSEGIDPYPIFRKLIAIAFK